VPELDSGVSLEGPTAMAAKKKTAKKTATKKAAKKKKK
jgi:hypothetical protein